MSLIRMFCVHVALGPCSRRAQSASGLRALVSDRSRQMTLFFSKVLTVSNPGSSKLAGRRVRNLLWKRGMNFHGSRVRPRFTYLSIVSGALRRIMGRRNKAQMRIVEIRSCLMQKLRSHFCTVPWALFSRAPMFAFASSRTSVRCHGLFLAGAPMFAFYRPLVALLYGAMSPLYPEHPCSPFTAFSRTSVRCQNRTQM